MKKLSFLWFVFLASVSFAQNPSFPAIKLTNFNPTVLSTSAFSYQMTDYDSINSRVLFYPYGSVTPSTGNTGVLLSYNLKGSGNFQAPGNWTATDISSVASSSATNFGGGFLNSAGTYLYLPPAVQNGSGVQRAAEVAVQVNLAKNYANPNDPTAYAVFNPLQISGATKLGSFSGIFANGYAYFCPTLDSITFNYYGDAIRYQEGTDFTNASNWQLFSMPSLNSGDASLGGMQSMAYISPNIYYIPFSSGSSQTGTYIDTKIVAYNTTGSFMSSTSWNYFDLSTLPFPSTVQVQMGGFTGGIQVSTGLVMIPWGGRSQGVTNTIALIYDTTKALNDTTAYQYFDVSTIDPLAGGYQFGWTDKHGFVFFVPTYNYNNPSNLHFPPYIAWNTALPFNSQSSWTTYSVAYQSSISWGTGASYDAAIDTAWTSGYGTANQSGFRSFLTQIQEIYPAPLLTGGAVISGGGVLNL